MLVIVVLVTLVPFLGRELHAPKAAHEAPLSMWLGPALLAALGLLFGLAPDSIGQALVVPGASAVAGAPLDFYLALWHGLTPALWLSLATVAAGIVLTFAWRPLHDRLLAAFSGTTFGPAGAYEAFLTGLKRLAAWQTRVLQSDDLRHHLTIILAFAVGLLGLTLLLRGGPPVAPSFEFGALHEIAFLVLIAVAALAVVRAHSRLVAITALGVVGFGFALVFVLFSAPDLAITQFLVETLIVIIVALVLIRLPHALLRDEPRHGERALSGFVAISGGMLLTTLLLAVATIPFDRTLTEYFEASSYPEALGRNIVNVILVDFRALDTLGEIVVLAVAAAGAFALLRRSRDRRTPRPHDGPRGLGEDDASAPASEKGGPA